MNSAARLLRAQDTARGGSLVSTLNNNFAPTEHRVYFHLCIMPLTIPPQVSPQ